MFYWKQTDWNKFTLIGDDFHQVFDSYEELYKFCVANHIDAQLA